VLSRDSRLNRNLLDVCSAKAYKGRIYGFERVQK
jgi:hypothetical protein